MNRKDTEKEKKDSQDWGKKPKPRIEEGTGLDPTIAERDQPNPDVIRFFTSLHLHAHGVHLFVYIPIYTPIPQYTPLLSPQPYTHNRNEPKCTTTTKTTTTTTITSPHLHPLQPHPRKRIRLRHAPINLARTLRALQHLRLPLLPLPMGRSVLPGHGRAARSR